MQKLLLAVIAALLAVGTLVAISPANAHQSERGERTVRHSCTDWVWFGPRSWDASCSTNGITVLGDRGATVDLGFSSTVCAPGATYDQSVTRYYQSLRSSLKQSGWKFDATSSVARPAGASSTYRRQTISFHTGRGAKKLQGVSSFDYDFTTAVDGVSYCYQRSIARYAKGRDWDRVKGTLAKVERSFAYSGPGAYEDQD